MLDPKVGTRGSQCGKIGITLAVVLLAVAVGLAFLIERVLIPWYEQPPAPEAVERYRLTPIDQIEGMDLTPQEGVLRCSALGEWSAFERSRNFVIGDGVLALERGDVQAFYAATEGGEVIPSALSERFEWWRGEISADRVVLEGWYTEGTDTIKTISMTGTLSEGELMLEGVRGPRNCQFEATLTH